MEVLNMILLMAVAASWTAIYFIRKSEMEKVQELTKHCADMVYKSKVTCEDLHAVHDALAKQVQELLKKQHEMNLTLQGLKSPQKTASLFPTTRARE